MTVVEARLKERIARQGPVPFAEFMEEALYGEGGYYARDRLPIGEGGDFVTAASHSPLFAATTARLLRLLDRELEEAADYLEAGYGNGEHLAALIACDAVERRRLAWDRVRREVPAGARALAELDELGAHGLEGLVFSFELFDALAVHRLIQGPAGLGELWVGVDPAGAFEWREGELSRAELAELVPGVLEPGQIVDLAPGWRPLYRRLAETLRRGLVVTCDYGFEAERLLDVRVRRFGTLACYRRHRVHRDLLRDAGEQDLTAHVDFSALIEEGEAAGLETLAFTRLAPWLASLGLLEGLAASSPADRLRAMQIMALDGMGEEIRVLVQARGVGRAVLGTLEFP